MSSDRESDAVGASASTPSEASLDDDPVPGTRRGGRVAFVLLVAALAVGLPIALWNVLALDDERANEHAGSTREPTQRAVDPEPEPEPEPPVVWSLEEAMATRDPATGMPVNAPFPSEHLDGYEHACGIRRYVSRHVSSFTVGCDRSNPENTDPIGRSLTFDTTRPGELFLQLVYWFPQPGVAEIMHWHEESGGPKFHELADADQLVRRFWDVEGRLRGGCTFARDSLELLVVEPGDGASAEEAAAFCAEDLDELKWEKQVGNFGWAHRLE